MPASRLIIPFIDTITAADARLTRLARFSGIECSEVPFGTVRDGAHSADANACLVLNPDVVRRSGATDAKALLDQLRLRWRFFLVHGLGTDPWSAALATALSNGAIGGVEHASEGGSYVIPGESRPFTGSLAGLTFGPVRRADLVLRTGPSSLETLVSASDRPMLVSSRTTEGGAVVFLAGGEIADITSPLEELRLESYFSRAAVPAIAIRFMFGDRCWRPRDCSANLIIDDPTLWKRFGFIRFSDVLRLLDEHDFHMTVAFIPYNYRRSSRDVAEMFRSRPDRLSLCFHGNDHTAGEFMSRDAGFLSNAVAMARSRMQMHHALTGIRHDDVMVFPQGGFSSHAMAALRTGNLVAAINSGGYPKDQSDTLTLADLLAPGITRFSGFPLFFRRYVRDYSDAEIALQSFFGKPLLIGEHHQLFKDADALVSLVERIRKVVPDVRWTSPQSAVQRASLSRRDDTDAVHVRIFANSGVLHNDDAVSTRLMVERSDVAPKWLDRIVVDGDETSHTLIAGSATFQCTVPPQSRREYRVLFAAGEQPQEPLRTFRTRMQIFLRRRLSEIRAMYLDSNVGVASARQVIRALGANNRS